MNFQFGSLSEFWHMAGHGPYVWACYAVAAVLLSYLAISPMVSQRRFLKQLNRQIRLQAHNSDASTATGK